MSACQTLIDNASLGVAPALRAVDCLAGETTAAAFGRLFGTGGALLPALTIILTLYIAFFALSLITGRSRLGISALTPRMLTLGMVLTFATSWAAYQGVVWNLAIGAPDQIAGALMGSSGSATQLFADRMDMVFAAIAEAATGSQAAAAQAAEGAQQAAQAAPAAAAAGNFTPTNLTWLAALVLLLGTVGVLVTARIALAVLLALGPIFIVMALFSGTRGLCAGWLRGVVLTAVTPLFVVIGGGIVMELLVPVVAMLRDVEGVNGRAALALFLIAAVHATLMVMVMRVAGTMVAGWRIFGLSSDGKATADAPQTFLAASANPAIAAVTPVAASTSRRGAILMQTAAAGEGGAPAAVSGPSRGGRTVVNHVSGAEPALPPLARQRARGIGSRFRAPQPRAREMMR
jgi:type IV secretion system protein VirB6